MYGTNKPYMCFNSYITDRLPFSIKVLLESAVRNCDEFQVTKKDVEKILDWENNQMLREGVEVAFKPARVLLQVKSPKNYTQNKSLYFFNGIKYTYNNYYILL